MSVFPRTIVNQEVEHPYRYNVYDKDTTLLKYTVDIVPTWEDNPDEIIQRKTEIDEDYLAPIEKFIKDVEDDLAELGLEISGSNTRISTLETTLATKAPLNAPVLVNPTANNVPITANNNAVAVTASVYSYVGLMMAEFKG